MFFSALLEAKTKPYREVADLFFVAEMALISCLSHMHAWIIHVSVLRYFDLMRLHVTAGDQCVQPAFVADDTVDPAAWTGPSTSLSDIELVPGY